MRLFHITCYHHIGRIAPDGVINTTESNIGAPKIMDLKLHHDIAARESGNSNDPPLVMVWNPNDPTDVLTVPRDLLAKAEVGTKKYRRLTEDEIMQEVGDAATYKAKVVIDLELNTTKDGKFGDLITDTDATGEDLSPYGEHVGPDVVWLTRDATPRQMWALPREGRWDSIPDEFRKDQALIVVDVPDEEVHKWSEWAFEQGINEKWYAALAMNLDEHKDWYVIERPIPTKEWVGIWDLRTGQCSWLPPGTLPEGQQDDNGVPHDEYGFDTPIPEPWVPTRLRRN